MPENNKKKIIELGTVLLEKLTSYYLDSKAGKGAFASYPSMDDLIKTLELRNSIENGNLLSPERFHSFVDYYLENTMHLHHPGYFGHQVSVPHPASMFAEMIHGMANQPMSLYEMGPSAAVAEWEVVQWMLEKIGWQNNGAGVLTHGGSLANLTALLSARAVVAPEAWEKGNPTNLVVLAPENAHYSIARAISMMGLGSQAIIAVPTDIREVIIPSALPEIIRENQTKGHRIMAVVANACATATGLYDPISEIGEICNNANIWLHLDSPHGATAVLSEKYNHLLQGIELADSIIWDAHKMMRVSTLCTGVLFKNQVAFKNTFTQKASYLFHEKENEGYDSIPYQVECTKSGLGAKLGWVLGAMGEKGIAQYVETMYDRTRQFAQIIDSTPGFEIFSEPESNILCFQYQGEKYDQLQLREKLIRTGKYYITTTEIHGVRYLRMVLMNEQTSAETIRDMLKEIEIIAEKL